VKILGIAIAEYADKMAKTERADLLLVTQGLCETREQAKRLIMAGEVLNGTHKIAKPSSKLPHDAELVVKNRPKYVSRAGFKLEGALEVFNISVENITAVDIGSSTGGFTDCLLQNGAAKVHAVDVGTNQLVYKLRTDPRVVVKEQFNARYLEVEDLGEQVDLAVMDVSFISLTKIWPAAKRVLKPNGQLIALIKPQFELSKEEVSAGKGIIRDPELHTKAVEKMRTFNEELGMKWINVTDSPITGTDGNKEFLVWLKM